MRIKDADFFYDGKKKTSKLKICCVVIGICLLVGGGYKLFTALNDYKKAEALYEETNEIYVVNEFDDVIKLDSDIEITPNEVKWDELINVDLASLRKENEDIVGWIYFENEDISYPILYSGDNTTYLRKTYNGEKAQAGSIFIDEDNNSDFSDLHTIIYGHNMKDLSMFGRLRYYETDANYINGHEYFQIITENKKYRYKIFSYKLVSGDSGIYTIYKDGSKDFESFVTNIVRKGSYINTDDLITIADHCITLSTCIGDYRFVVSAVRCDEYNID